MKRKLTSILLTTCMLLMSVGSLRAGGAFETVDVTAGTLRRVRLDRAVVNDQHLWIDAYIAGGRINPTGDRGDDRAVAQHDGFSDP